MTLVLAGIMTVGMGVTALAAEGGRGDYSTKFTGSAAMAAMSDYVFDGADVEYEDGELTVTVYTKLYERDYNGGKAYGWISELTLDGEEAKPAEWAEINGASYPTAFQALIEAEPEDLSSIALDALVSVEANGYTHKDQAGVLTLTAR